ncbi:MAG: YeaH/YhbH family protein [Alphaproteobacteria bacterium]
MFHFIDRRQNPKDKSLGNRQRFMRRARARIKEVVEKSIKDRKLSDIANGEEITIPTKGIDEPRFRHSSDGGRRERVFTGNKEFRSGDEIEKPEGGGQGKGGKQGSDSGEGEDEFRFALTREEFLDLFFEDLELPDLVKTNLREVITYKMRRTGHSATGTPTNLNVLRTMCKSLGRRLALNRPKRDEIAALEDEIAVLEAKAEPNAEELTRLEDLRQSLKDMLQRRRWVPYIDPVDIRYNNYAPMPEPNTKAVMICVMDVSGSMGEREKDLAKRFFILLHLFLNRRYKQTDVVFIRHTHEAQEVDEDTFFYSQETGGTVVSTALVEMLKVIRDRYPTSEWNIYGAQASDGENHAGDTEKCIDMLSQEIMPLCQYYAYVEILDERETEIFRNMQNGAALWQAYRTIADAWPNFAMKRIAKPGDIYPVFRELFAKQSGKAAVRS